MEGGAAHGVVEVVVGVVGLLVVAAVVRAAARRLRLPFTVALVLAGILVAWLAGQGVQALQPVARLEIGPEVILFVFLPTLIFESAFELDARDLRENLGPVLTLAVPGMLFSMVVIGLVARLSTPLVGVQVTWPQALLLGAILSATDPVAVIALFRQLGAPRRLTVLVEGESLFNDATAIVVSKILVGIAAANAAAAGAGSEILATLADGAVEFLVVFFGGLAVGWALSTLVGTLLGRVRADAFLEISLTTILAYAAFLVAEHYLHVSGVMAVVAAGVLIGGWGRTKISPSVADSLEHFWEYLAGVANALVFLMVGLRVDLGALQASLPVIACVVGAMLASRAVVVYGTVPLIEKLPGTEPIDRGYRTVMFWGGLRGAVALAIVLSLPEAVGPEVLELFVAVSIGAVLFTLLVPGLTIRGVVRHFGLDEPPLADRVARLEGLMSAESRALEEIPRLEEEGLLDRRVAASAAEQGERDLAELRAELERLREEELDREQERRILHLRCFGEERTLYYRMFARGHVSERSYRDLKRSVELQIDAMRHEGELRDWTLYPPSGRTETVLLRLLDRIPGLGGLVEELRARRTARDYEISWARARGSERILEKLDELAEEERARRGVVEEVRETYEAWREAARRRLDETAEQFPEFVSATQERLADRLVLHAEKAAIEERAEAGIVPDGVAETVLEEKDEELRELRSTPARSLQVSPEELLRKVPFFRDLPADEVERVVGRLRRRTTPAGEAVVRQGARGSSLYLVARGVVRVVREGAGEDGPRELATLTAGDFFGEMALLHGDERSATCRAATPCALYELRREDVLAVQDACPAMREALVEADRRRRDELDPPDGEDG